MNEGTGAHHVTGVLVPIRVISLVERKPVLTRESVVGTMDSLWNVRGRGSETIPGRMKSVLKLLRSVAHGGFAKAADRGKIS
jgi:hypothetical protein